MQQVGLGGSCHWCTEAIFQSLRGVTEVLQGWISSSDDAAEPSEAVIVKFDEAVISLDTIIAVHLHSHSCTSNHSMRKKYRSAVYAFNNDDLESALLILKNLQPDFACPIITQVLPFKSFKLNTEQFLNYYQKDKQKPFCRNIVDPKLALLKRQFGKIVTY